MVFCNAASSPPSTEALATALTAAQPPAQQKQQLTAAPTVLASTAQQKNQPTPAQWPVQWAAPGAQLAAPDAQLVATAESPAPGAQLAAPDAQLVATAESPAPPAESPAPLVATLEASEETSELVIQTMYGELKIPKINLSQIPEIDLSEIPEINLTLPTIKLRKIGKKGKTVIPFSNKNLLLENFYETYSEDVELIDSINESKNAANIYTKLNIVLDHINSENEEDAIRMIS